LQRLGLAAASGWTLRRAGRRDQIDDTARACERAREGGRGIETARRPTSLIRHDYSLYP